MSFFRALLVSLSAFLIAAQPADAGRLKIKGGYLQQNLGSLALSTPNGTAGASGSSAITGATPGSTLTMQNTVGGLYSVDSGARSLIWTSSVVAGTDNPVVRETLAGFANSPHDNTLPVTIAASGYTTGQSIAKAGAAQYPNLLDANAGTNTNGVSVPYRPSWAVAGVDYRVGPSDTQVYKVLNTDALPTCANSINNTTHRIYIQTLPCTLDGWDFQDYTLDTQYATGTGTFTVQNSKYLATTSFPGQFIWTSAYDQSMDITVQFNIIDGDYQTGSGFDGLIAPGGGNTLIQMNWIKHTPDDGIHIRSQYGTLSVTTRWNLIQDIGGYWETHGDVLQGNGSLGGGHDFANIHSTGNTIYQENGNGSNQPATANTVFRLGDNPTGTNFVNPEWDHDTIVSIGTNHAGSNAGSPYYAYPGNINLEQVGDAVATGRGNTTNWLVHDNWFFSDSTTWASTQRTIYGIYAQTHVVNVTYTISPNNYFMWDGTTWPTTLP